MIFEKPSLRTRVTFEVGMTQLGGYAVYLAPGDIRLGERESVADIARNLARWVDLIMARTFSHDTLRRAGRHTPRVPVINGLSDLHHPCQVLADCFTLLEHRGRLDGLRVAFIGDGNNMAHSWMDAAALFGFDFAPRLPARATSPTPAIVAACRAARRRRSSVTDRSVADARARRRRRLHRRLDQHGPGGRGRRAPRSASAGYQVNAATAARCAKPDALVMHCLPAHRGEEITDDVLDGRSRSSSTRPRTACTCRRRSWSGSRISERAGPLRRTPAGRGSEMSDPIKKIVLAYSGGLDTSVILELADRAPTAARSSPSAPTSARARSSRRSRARRSDGGASEVFIDDLREEFVRDFVFPMLRANAVYEGSYLLGTSIARPLIAKRQIEIARADGRRRRRARRHRQGQRPGALRAHLLRARARHPRDRAVARPWDLNSRTKLIAYAEQHRHPGPGHARRSPTAPTATCCTSATRAASSRIRGASRTRTCSCSRVSPEKAPDKPEYVEIDFEAGDPVAVNGERLVAGGAARARSTTIGGRHGIGRVDLVENRYVGMKSRGVYETPGGTILHAAHRAVESLTLDREVLHLRDSLIPRYAEMVYYGYWFAPERQMLQTRHRRVAAARSPAPRGSSSTRATPRSPAASRRAVALRPGHRDLRGRLASTTRPTPRASSA